MVPNPMKVIRLGALRGESGGVIAKFLGFESGFIVASRFVDMLCSYDAICDVVFILNLTICHRLTIWWLRRLSLKRLLFFSVKYRTKFHLMTTLCHQVKKSYKPLSA